MIGNGGDLKRERWKQNEHNGNCTFAIYLFLCIKQDVMKRLFVLISALVLCMSAEAQSAIHFKLSEEIGAPLPKLPDNVYVYMDTQDSESGRLALIRPCFFIYPDSALSVEESDILADELGFNGFLREYVGLIAIVNPVNGVSYDFKADQECYATLFNSIRVFMNLKIVGIGKGATFVNRAIAPSAHEVAGIVSIGGSPCSTADYPATVPAYIAGKNATAVAKSYIRQNKAVLVEKSGKVTTYASPEEPLLTVTVNTENASPAALFADAWDKTLSRNYRCSNLSHTGYKGASLGEFGPYELEDYLMCDRIGVERIIVKKELFRSRTKRNNYLWYEYLPEGVKQAGEHTVPLVVLLHGHHNDAKTQAETSGFVQLAARKNFIVAELEWQGKHDYIPESDQYYMGDDGIEAVVNELLKRYPQIDPSRIYAEGLSAGGFTATALGIRKSHLFAAVGAHSGGLFTHGFNLGFAFMDPESLKNEAAQKRGYVQMPYFSVGGTSDDGVPFNSPDQPNGDFLVSAWKLYQYLNGLEITEGVDLGRYPFFGIPLANRRRIETGKGHAVETGDACNADGVPLVRVVAVEHLGHANFVPDAELMWDYFSMFSRDPETKELRYNP